MPVATILFDGDLTDKVRTTFRDRNLETLPLGSLGDLLQNLRENTLQGVLLFVPQNSIAANIQLVHEMREMAPQITVFILAKTLDLSERLSLYEAGADYLAILPISASEIATRMQSRIILRSRGAPQTILRIEDLEVDFVGRRIHRAGLPIELRQKEFLMLEYFIRNANRVVTREMILENVWSSQFVGFTNVVDVHISNLRRKLGKPLIKTLRGVGYIFMPEPTA